MNKEEFKERFQFLDASKGLAIFLVVWGHVIQSGLSTIGNYSPFDNMVYRIIYSFHMPLFMCVSGYFFYDTTKKGIKNVIMNRVSSLLVLLFTWNTIHYICVLLIRSISYDKINFSFVEYVNELFQGYWFLWAILLYALVVGIGANIFHEKYQVFGILLLTPVILMSPVRWVAITQFPFFLAGFLVNRKQRKVIKKEKTKIFDNPKVRWIVLILFIALQCIYSQNEAIGIGAVKEWLDTVITAIKQKDAYPICVESIKLLLFYGMGATGSISTILWFRYFERKNYFFLMSIFERAGRYSLQIYILQRIFVELIITKFYTLFVEKSGSNPVISNVILFTYIWSILLTLFWLVLIYYTSKSIMKKSFGKKLMTGKVFRVDSSHVQSTK